MQSFTPWQVASCQHLGSFTCVTAHAHFLALNFPPILPLMQRMPVLKHILAHIAGSTATVPTASSEAMEQIMLWQINNLQHRGSASYLDGRTLFARFNEHCLQLSVGGQLAVTNVTIETIGEPDEAPSGGQNCWWTLLMLCNSTCRSACDSPLYVI